MNGFTAEQIENIKKTGRSGFLEGEFFHTGYYHTGCDNELMERCRQIGKYIWAEEAKVDHDHPVKTGFVNAKGEFRWGKMDAVYELAYRADRREHDLKLLKERAAKYGFPVKQNFIKPT